MPIRRGDGTGIASVRLGDGTEIGEIRLGDGTILWRSVVPIITSGLVSRYTFEGTGDASTLTDVHGTNDGTISGMSYVQDASGRPTNATGEYVGAFDGLGNDVVTPTSTGGFTGLSLSMWLWPASGSLTDSTDRVLLSNYDDANPRCFTLQKAGGDNGLDWFTQDDSQLTDFWDVGDASTLFTEEAWNHLVVTWDGSTKTAYVDGSSVASTSWSVPALDGDSPSNVTIAEEPDTGGGNNWEGRLDDVRVYNRGLSASEVTTIYNGNG